jgi:predicted dehydrogenase
MDEFRLIALDPGHFHAALVQKEMYPGVSRRAAVYAPLDGDLIEHLKRIARFNQRPESPTCWELDIHAGPDSLPRMLRDRPGNLVVLSGRNRGKIERIRASLDAGLNVLADKPWIVRSADLGALEAALATAARGGLLAYDIMTERYEISSMLQRELVNDPEVFGDPLAGTPGDPAVRMESVHHILKLVAGAPNPRPAWFFDIHEQGEALADVGTHLVDLAQWTLFPGRAIDYRADIQLLAASRWPTPIGAEQFRQVTGQPGEALDYYCNTSLTYALRGIHSKLDVLWRWEAPAGSGDTHYALYRGSRSDVEVRQGREENFQPELYVTPHNGGVEAALAARIAALAGRYPGLAAERQGDRWRVAIPAAYRVGHEAHFAQVTRQFFDYWRHPETFPAWENPNMLAKYYTATKGVDLSRGCGNG